MGEKILKIVQVEHMRRIEEAADESGFSYDQMMDNAGRAAAQQAITMLAHLDEDIRVTILIGAGNNGGDGLVCGRYIAEQREDIQVRFYLLKRREEDDPLIAATQDAGLFIAYAEDDADGRVLRNMIASADLVIDALFGIGVRLPIKGDAEKLLRNSRRIIQERRDTQTATGTINTTYPADSDTIPAIKVLAIDCPSGLDCDTGELDSNAIYADDTITFIAAKPGLLAFPGAAAVGNLWIAQIGIPDDLPELDEPSLELVTAKQVRALLPSRSIDSHKGSFGKTFIIGGSLNFIGAPGLCATAAYRAGAGLVTVGAPGPVVTALAAALIETTWVMLPNDMGVINSRAHELALRQMEDYDALLIGPGMGQEESTQDFLKTLLASTGSSEQPKRLIGFGATKENRPAGGSPSDQKLPPLVIDADALNMLAKMARWWERLPENTVITPHPGEMARLMDSTIEDVQSNRLQIAQEKAKEWNVVLVLKGAHTIIAHPEGQTALLPFKTDALATAGTGDVLAGLIAGFIAQDVKAFEAAQIAGYVHGLSGQLLAHRYSSRSVIAGDLLEIIPAALRMIENG